MHALILGGRAPAALELARRFAARGHAVTIGDSTSCRLSGSSRSVTDAVRLPPPRFALAEYGRAMAREISARAIDLVVPTCEEVFYLARIREALPLGCCILAPPFDLLARLHSKLEFIEMACGCGTLVPETFAARDLDTAREWAAGRAVVLKPEFSRFGVHVRIYPDGIPADAQPLSLPGGRWAVQSLCRGTEVCSYAIAFEGKVQANICYRPTYRLRRSSSYYFEPIAVPAIDAAVSRLVRQTRYTGQVSFDWIVAAGGAATVLECNPRAISGVHLLPAGTDIAQVMAGTSCAPFDAGSTRPVMIAPVMLAAGLPGAVANGSVSRWWRDWRRARDTLSAPGDMMPVAGALADLASFTVASLRQGCSLREAATRDIEWDGDPLCA